MGFIIEVPHKRERNAFIISQIKGEALKPTPRQSKKHKKNRKGWKKENWGE